LEGSGVFLDQPRWVTVYESLRGGPGWN